MNNKLNQWLAFLDGREGELMEMAIKKNKVLQKAKLQLSYLTGEEEVRRLEELEEKWAMDRNSAIDYAETKGRKEKQIEVAKEMLKRNMEIKLISEITKLEIQEIEELKNSNLEDIE